MIRGFILTGHKEQYKFFIKHNNLNPSEFPMLKNISQLSKNTLVIKTGTYFMNSLYKRVLKFENTMNDGEKSNECSNINYVKGDDLDV